MEVTITSPVLVEVIATTRMMVITALILLLTASLSSREVPAGVYGDYIAATAYALAMEVGDKASR